MPYLWSYQTVKQSLSKRKACQTKLWVLQYIRPLIFADNYQFIVNTLRPRGNGSHFPDDILKWIILKGTVQILIKISLNFVPKGLINDNHTLVQTMAWHLPGDKPLSEPLMISLLTHICVARPQWLTNAFCNKKNEMTGLTLSLIRHTISLVYITPPGVIPVDQMDFIKKHWFFVLHIRKKSYRRKLRTLGWYIYSYFVVTGFVFYKRQPLGWISQHFWYITFPHVMKISAVKGLIESQVV